MKNKIYRTLTSASDIAEHISPYAIKTGKCFKRVAGSVSNKANNMYKKVKKHMKFVKIKQAIELITNIVLLIAAMIALVISLLQVIGSKDK